MTLLRAALAQMYIDRGEPESAREELTTAITADPASVDPRVLLVVLEFAEGNDEQGLAHLDVLSGPTFAPASQCQALHSVAQMLLKQGRSARALATDDLAIRIADEAELHDQALVLRLELAYLLTLSDQYPPDALRSLLVDLEAQLTNPKLGSEQHAHLRNSVVGIRAYLLFVEGEYEEALELIGGLDTVPPAWDVRKQIAAVQRPEIFLAAAEEEGCRGALWLAEVRYHAGMSEHVASRFAVAEDEICVGTPFQMLIAGAHGHLASIALRSGDRDGAAAQVARYREVWPHADRNSPVGQEVALVEAALALGP